MAPKKHNEVEFVNDFIDVFKQHPSLWKIKSPEYSNRTMKQKGYRALIEIYKNHEIEPVSEDIVKKKISALRASFRREMKKIKSMKSGMGGDEAEEIEPSLWYYNQLLFLVDHEEIRKNNSNDIDSDDDVDEVRSEVSEDNPRDNPEIRPPKQKNKSQKINAASKHDQEQKEKLLKRAYEALANDDEYDAYGVTVAAKLRKLQPEQRLYCENVINMALFKATLNQLTEQTTLTSPPPPPIQRARPQQMTSFNINEIISNRTIGTSRNSFISLSTLDRQTSSQTDYEKREPAGSSCYEYDSSTASNSQYIFPVQQRESAQSQQGNDDTSQYFHNFNPEFDDRRE